MVSSLLCVLSILFAFSELIASIHKFNAIGSKTGASNLYKENSISLLFFMLSNISVLCRDIYYSLFKAKAL